VASGRLIGDAYIVIRPQTDGFATQARAAIQRDLAAIRPTVDIRPVVSPADVAAARAGLKRAFGPQSISAFLDPASLAKIDAAIAAQAAAARTAFQGMHTDFSVGTKVSPADLEASRAALQAFLDRNLLTARVTAKLDPAALAKANAAIASWAAGIRPADIPVKVDPASLARAQAALDAALHGTDVPVSVNIAPARTALSDLSARASVLGTQLQNLRASVSDTGALAKITALQVRADALDAALAKAGSDANLAPFESRLLGIQAAFEGLTAVQKVNEAETNRQAGIWETFGLKGAGSLIHITDLLNASIPPMQLFGGAIGMMYTGVLNLASGITGFSGLANRQLPTVASHLLDVATSGHLTAEAAIELIAVWGPAAVAITAFAAAATPAVMQVTKQLTDMYVVSKATGQQWQSLATQGQSVTAAVKPTVMEAFGIALYAVQNHSSQLSSAMHTLGQDIDQMAAKAAVAFDRSSGQFFQTGVRDANALMVSFENLGSIIGTLMKAVPGYAEVLLGFGNDILGVAANVTKAVEPILASLLKLHGALLYGGLAGTAASWVFPKIVDAAANAALGVGLAAEKILGSESKIVSGATSLGGALQGLSAGPIVAGVGLVVGAFAALYMYLKVSQGAADNFNKTIQQTVQNSSLGKLQATLTSGIQQTTVRYTAALKQVQAAQDNVASGMGNMQFRLTGMSTTVQAATQAAGSYKAGLTQLTNEQKNVNNNLTQLAQQFGVSIPGALALANTAQITSNQLTASGAANYDTMAAQMHGAVAELNVMTAGTGTMNQALNALTVTQSGQVQSAQKLAQAYSSWIGIVTSGQSAFITFEQGQQTLASVMKQGDASGAKLSVTVGKLKEQYPLVGAAMNGLSPAALGVQQAFLQQIQSATTLYGNLQTMATVSGNTAAAQTSLARAGKDLVAQLLPMAAGSQEATADVYALAQMVGYTGVDSFKSLAQWLGNTKGAASDLNKQQAELTLSSANLTAAARDLSAAIGAEVTSAEAQAIAQTQNLSGKTLALAKAFSDSQGAASASVTTLAGQYYEALIQAGTGATTAKNDVDAFLTQLGATGGVVAQVNAALASLPKTVDINIQIHEALVNQVSVGGATNAILRGGGFEAGGIVHAARGLTVRGSGPAGKDSQLVMAAPGELVIPTSHAAKYGAMAKKDGIPGFEGGMQTFRYGAHASPYSYGSAVPAGLSASAAAVPPGDPLTRMALNRIAALLQEQNKLLAQMPYSQAQAINQAAGAGVRRGWFATSG